MRDEDTWRGGQGRSRWDKGAEEGCGQSGGMRTVSRDEDRQGDNDPGERQGHLEWTTVLGRSKDEDGWGMRMLGKEEDTGEGQGHLEGTRALEEGEDAGEGWGIWGGMGTLGKDEDTWGG